MIRCGIIGCGAVAREIHVPILQHLPDVELGGVCDVDPTSLSSITGPNAYTEYEDMLARENLDVVHLCTPPNIRLEPIRKVADSGIPLLVEKPTALTLDTLEQIRTIRDEQGVKVCCVQNVRFWDLFEEVRRKIRSGVVGEITAIDVTWSERKDLSGGRKGQQWVRDLSAGAISEAIPHPMYLALAFTDRLRGEPTIDSRRLEEETQWPDGVAIQATDDSGRFVSIRFLTRANMGMKLWVYGTEGELLVDLRRRTITVDTTHNESMFPEIGSMVYQRTRTALENYADRIGATVSDQPAFLSNSGWSRGHYRLIREFIDAVKMDGEVPVPIEAEYDVVKLLEIMENS